MALDDFQDILGQIVGVLAGIESIRKPGGIGDYFGTRLKAQTDPDTVAGLTGKPFLGGYYGLTGDVIPTAVDMPGVSYGSLPGGGYGQLRNPSAPEQQDVWTPYQPTIGPNAFLKTQLDEATLAQKQQEVANAGQFARMFPNGLPTGWEPLGMTVDATGRQVVQVGPASGVTLPGGTLTPGGLPYRGGERLPTGERVRAVTPEKGGLAGKADLQRLRGAREAFAATFGANGPAGDPLDILPSASETTAAGLFRTQQPFKFFTSAGEGPGFIAGGAPSIPRLAREGDPRAVVLVKGNVARSEIARGFGGLGNLNENEQKVVEEILPNAEDTRELAQQKRAFITRLFDGVEQGLASGQIATQDDLKTAILGGAASFQPGVSGPTPSPGTTPTTLPPLSEPRRVESIDLGNGFSARPVAPAKR